MERRYTSPGIQVIDLTRVFPGRPRPALESISFSLQPGECGVVAGPNEAGKSTLIRILATLIVPTRGRAVVCGHDVVREALQVRRRVGVVLDGQRTFYYRLTAYQNLEFFGGLRGLCGRELRRRIEVALEQVGLAHARDVRFMKFSAGMRKRLAIARAILHDPPVLLFDEPLAHLDDAQVERIAALVQDLRSRGKTILITTHRPEKIGAWADRMWRLQGGKIFPAS